MKKLIFTLCYLISIVFILSGCETPSDNMVNLKFDETISEIKSNRPFTIRLPDDHPDKLAIVTPDETWFYIQGNGFENQLMSPDEFLKIESITINPSTLKGTFWEDGKVKTALIFIKKGIYSIYLSDNLETEIDNSLTYIKKIKLIN